uniref:Protein TIC 214 n=2 Tax=Aponogeton TaxID=51593 RepID=A0A872PK82_9LILI|nr:hypothetical protein RF1 [Aponogeton abyssinicus]QOX09232.1 hypothetical protein RF1 [Aponogeton abyssinicus]
MSFIVYLFLYMIWKVKKSSYNNREIAIEKKKGRFVMILKSFLLGNLLSLCIKIINSVTVIGFYYGLLTTFSIGPSYLFLLRARVTEEGVEKKISATTGFIIGQLMMFISIYYAPLHLALGRPHTITVLVIPYLLFHFFWDNDRNSFDYRSTNVDPMRNLSIQCVFLNNLVFQLFNHFILPSSTLARLVTISMFRCNNKMLFVTSSFVGWLIGHILFIKWVGLVLFWIQQNNSIRSNRYFVSELRNFMARIFSILLFITCVYYLGRMPSPIVTKKLKQTSEIAERQKSEEEIDVETTYESKTKETKQEQEGFNDYKNSYLDRYQELWELKNKEEKKNFWFEKPLVTLLFDYKRWNRPLRYIKNDQFEKAVRNEMSQYFFYTCPSDGKQRISFTYPPSLSTFSKIIERKISLYTIEKLSHENKNLYNHWVYTNEQKKHNLSNELINRIKVLEKQMGFCVLDVLEKRTRLYNDGDEEGYLPKKYDPCLNGPYRVKKKKFYSRSTMNDLITSIQDSIRAVWINKIHGLFTNDYREFSIQKNPYIDLKNKEKFSKFVFDVVTNNPNDEAIRNQFITIEEISKKVPRWPYKLTDELEEEEEEENQEESTEDHEIRSRKAKRVVIYTDKDQDTNSSTNNNNSDQGEEVFLLRYSQQSDFRRDLIKGSMRAQRRKTVTWEMFQANVHSPLFLYQIDKTFFFSFDFSEIRNLLFRNWTGKEAEILNSDSEEEDIKEKKKKNKEKQEENERIAISEAWDTIIFAQAIRGSMLLTQSIFRKYIALPFLIIAKNIGRMLLLQFPEWYEDLRDWNKEMHVKCTYNGIQLSETEFPKNWLRDGIQIKILFPFRLKPWQGAKVRSHHMDTLRKKDDFCFLTVWGTEAEFPFGSPRKQPSFFEPIFKELKKKIRKAKKKCFLILRILTKKIKWFLNTLKEKAKWVQKIVLVIKGILKELEKRNLIYLFELNKMKVYEPIENTKNSIISSNKNTQELIIRIQSMNWTNYSLIEKKMKDIADRTIKIRNQIEQIKKDKKKIVRTLDRNSISPNKTIFNDKKSKLWKHPWLIFKKESTRLIHKLHYFLKSFIEKIYIDIFLHIINILRINGKLFIESKKQNFNKSIIKDKTNQEEVYIDETNKNTIQFILTIKKSLSNTNTKISNKNSNLYCDLSSLSQAYVFYKISRTQLYNFRSLLQYQDHENHLFIKDRIKDYCATQGIFDSKSKHKTIYKYGMNEWKNWLRGHYQYNLSQTKWSRLVPQKWRNRVNLCCKIQNKENSMKLDSYKKEKDSSIHYVKQKYYEVNSLIGQKEKIKKNYRYNLFLHKYISHNYINYKNRGGSYIYGSQLQLNGNQEIGYPYNSNTKKLQVIIGIDINDYINGYLGKKSIIYRKKILEKKYFNCRIFHFLIGKNINIDTWVNLHTGTKINQNTKTRTDSYQKFYNKDILSPTIYQEIKPSKSNKKKSIFDWMGMNQERLYRRRSNPEPQFLPEFGILYDTYNTYKIKPWIIPIRLLLFNLDVNENVSQNKNINEKKNLHISSNKKEYFELENRKQEKKQQPSQVDFNLDTQNRKKKKDIEEDYTRPDIKKRRKKKQYKSKNEAELDLFLKKYFLFQLRWDNPLNQRMTNNIKVYCLLLRLVNPKEITISSIERGEMSLDVMLIPKDLALTELIKKGILIIEPIRLSIKWDAKFIMYQMMNISLIKKNKYQTNGKYKKKIYLDKNSSEKCIAQQHNSIFVNENKNHYDFLVPEHILSTRRRKELRILICFNSWNRNVVNGSSPFGNENSVRNCGQFSNEDQYPHTNINKLMKFKLFIWPNYRLEDLACMNRYWFNTNNGSRFTISRIYMYPRFKIN